MGKWLKGFIAFSMSLLLVSSFSMSASAATTKAYLVKDDSGKVYYYNASELEDSFLNDQLDLGDNTLYLDFVQKLSKYGFYSFMSDEGKYVDYSIIEDAFLQNPDNFNLTDFLSSAQAKAVSDLPATVTTVRASNGTIVTDSLDTGSTGGSTTPDEPVVPEVVDIY